MRRLLFAAIAALTLAGCSSAFSSDPQPVDAAPATTAAPAPVDSTPAVASIVGWWAGGGSDAVSMLKADISQLAKDSGAGIDALSTDCIQLTADVTVAQKLPVVPDAVAQKHWSAAIKALHKGALDCNAGASAGSMRQVRAAGSEIDAAGPEFAAFAQRVAQLTK